MLKLVVKTVPLQVNLVPLFIKNILDIYSILICGLQASKINFKLVLLLKRVFSAQKWMTFLNRFSFSFRGLLFLLFDFR